MKNAASLAIALLVAYLALIFAVENLGAGSSVACSAEFTLTGIACRVGAAGITLLLVPVSGVLAFFLARKGFAG